jgi:DNA-binding NtrC family response regulator
LDRLRRYSFPGNVRELRNLVERLIIMTEAETIGSAEIVTVLPAQADAAPADAAGDAGAARLADAVREFERRQIEAALRAAQGNVTEAASRLGLERSHLYKKMRKLAIASRSTS